MFINQTAEYAMRAMTVIAGADEPLPAAHIAEQADIPAPYSSKLLRRLVVAQLLSAKRGKGGGFVLTRQASEISFADILDAVDAMPRPDHCAFGWAHCDPAAPCPLHVAYEEARTNFLVWAQQTRLSKGS